MVLESSGQSFIFSRHAPAEAALVRSVRRKPVEFNLTMVNRLLNAGIHEVNEHPLAALLVSAEQSGESGEGQSSLLGASWSVLLPKLAKCLTLHIWTPPKYKEINQYFWRLE